MLHLHVCPISGGGFSPQIGLITRWSQVRRRLGLSIPPDVVLAASGGNVASYVSLASQYSFSGVDRVCSKLESSMFVRSWWPSGLSFLPTAMIGLFTGSVYRPGYGAETLFKSIFSPASLQTVEIWTGTFNKTLRRAQLFCNRDVGTSLLPPPNDESFYYLAPSIYMSGDLSLAAKVSLASASIPLLVEDQVIDGNEYVDGGNMYASTITPMADSIETVFRQTSPILHLMYCQSYDMDNYTITGYHGVGGEAGNALATLLHAMTIGDRNASLDLFKRLVSSQGPISNARYDNLTESTLEQLLLPLKTRHTFICLFPYGAPSVDMSSFTGANVYSLAMSSTEIFGAEIWWC